MIFVGFETIYGQTCTTSYVDDLIGDTRVISAKSGNYEYHFNPKGQITRARGPLAADSIIYNPQGSIQMIYSSAMGKPREKIELEYDEHHLLIEVAYYAAKDDGYFFLNKLLFTNQEENKDGKIKRYKLEGGNATIAFHFDKQGLLTKQISIYPKQEYYWVEELEYSALKRVKKIKPKKHDYIENKWVLHYNKANDGLIPLHNKLNGTNYVLKKKTKTQKNSGVTNIYSYENDPQGNLVKKISQLFVKGALERELIYEYDYVFDDNGNWIERVSKVNNNSSKVTRTIQYR